MHARAGAPPRTQMRNDRLFRTALPLNLFSDGVRPVFDVQAVHNDVLCLIDGGNAFCNQRVDGRRVAQ